MDFGSMIAQWQKALTQPEPTFAAEAKSGKSGWNEGFMNFGIAYAITSVAGGVYSMVAMPKAAGFLGSLSLLSIPLGFIVAMVFSVIVAFVYHFLAGALGGSGKIEKTYYMLSMFGAPIGILSLVAYIPCLGTIAAFALMIYNAYLLTLCIKAAYGLDTVKALITWLAPGIILLIIVFAVAAMFAASMLGSLAAFPGAGALY